MTKRGAFIVLEGCDCSGKTTQCKNIVQSLRNKGFPAETVAFPDRTTETGKLIDSFLQNNADLPDQAIHLLFTANRWELMPKMKELLMNGTTLIVDRYSYSGVAYSYAKKNAMNLEWYKNPESGLLKPDVVFFLNLEPEVIKRRKGFGEEIYEKTEFQEAVHKCFRLLMDDSWKIIDANDLTEKLTETLLNEIIAVVNRAEYLPLSTLW